jgi:hypothetical protein
MPQLVAAGGGLPNILPSISNIGYKVNMSVHIAYNPVYCAVESSSPGETVVNAII